jgi:NitT/TauT family transport system substrate-binding protein
MSVFRKLFLSVVLSIFVFSSVPAFTAAPEQKLEKVTIAQFGKEKFLLYFPLYIAMEEGLFKKRGIDVDLKFAGNDDQIFASVISGAADFGMGDPVFAAIAKDKGGPGKVVAMMITKLGLSGYTNNPKIPMIQKPEQLNHLRISSFPEPSTTYTLLKQIIMQNKLDTKIVQAGFGAQLATLEAGKTDIAIDLEPTVSIAEDKGYRVVLNFEDYSQPQVITGLMTTEETIKNHPETVQKIVSGLQEALVLVHKKPEIAVGVAKKIFPELKDSVIQAAVKRMLANNIYPQSDIVPDDLWQRTLKTRLASGDLKKPQATSVAVDNSFALKAQKETDTAK